MLQDMEEHMACIREHLLTSQDRQKKYVDVHRVDKQFFVGDRVFLRVRSRKSPIRYEKCSKLAARFVGPFDILEWIGPVEDKQLSMEPMRIHQHREISLRGQSIEQVKFHWDLIDDSSATWEDAVRMKELYPYLFSGFQQ
ncbi:uncharacterized protein LOC131856875 [Cryptomeria japonica]|uniref:uncharacterized protein LOC131856875 n=1 Tax=Cryptomeria japonica TaxID=3369 RepID=UPI0027D9DAC5|nr:uncharacterized protein LOC131856875 [Cryptomeria japonica]